MLDLRDRLAAALSPRYVVDRELAAGGMGTVFLGHDPTLGRQVAIKVLPPERATAVAVERFLREARLLAQLAHPHVVTILEASQSGELIWYVMPRVEGDTLAHRLLNGPLSANQVRRLGMDLLSALEHAHAQGVIHRDIKPANIFLQGDRALLADFGVALLNSSQSEPLTDTNQLVGTLRYMAPEQRTGGEATAQSDVYALGVTLFEAATGHRWDPNDSTTGRAWRAVPGRLSHALRGALRTDPARRWKDAATFRQELAAARRRPSRGWVLASGVVIFAAIAAMVGRQRATARPAVNAVAELAVLSFTGADDSLETQVAAFTSLPLEFSPIAMVPWLRSGRMTTDSARQIARYIVTGSFIGHRGPIDTLEIQVHDSSGRALDDLRVSGRPDDPAAWGQAIADSLVHRLFPLDLTEFRQLAGATNRVALDTLLEGQRLFQAGDWGGAEAKFAAAEALDSLLVQASWRRLIARQWQGLPWEDELARLAAQADHLPQPIGELVRLQLEPDLERRMAGFDSLAGLKQFRQDAMVREMQANELFSRGPLVGRPLSEGVAAFASAARQVPALDQPTTYTQTIWGAVRIGDRPLATEQLALRKAVKGDPWTRILWLAVKGRFQRWLAVPARTLLLATADSSDRVALARAVRMGLEVDDPWDQEAIAKSLEHRATTNRGRAGALAAQATALLLVGRPMAALARLDRGAGLVPRDAGYQLQRGEWRVLLPLLPGAPIAIPRAARDSGRQILRAVSRDDSVWPRAAWALAVDAIGRHDHREADSLIALLRAVAVSPGVADLATFAAAISLGDAAEVDSALTLSRRIYLRPRDADAGARGPFVRALTYLHRGWWQVNRRDPEAAERAWLWHENNDVRGLPTGEPLEGELDAALSAVARLLRAENLVALDRDDAACHLLARVADLWRDAEPAFDALRIRVAAARKPCLN